MLRATLWFVAIVLTSMSCAGPRAVQPTSDASYPALETVQQTPESVDRPVLRLDEISLADSLQYAKDPLQTLQSTRNYYEIALSSTQAQDFEAAQTAIDEALRRLVALSDLQETWVVTGRKELLRDISRLVVKVHEGGSLIVPERRGEITRDTNSQVTKQITWWIRYSPGALKMSYARSGLYYDIIRSELEKRGMPQELQWLPAVESNFKPRAYSWADAAGLWQFIMGTGSRYGLNRTGYVDDRMDPFKATGAALDYLNDLYEMFGDWHLALAAYNCGENRVLRAINRQGTTDFWQLRLPKETRRYVPRFLAAVYLFENPQLYDIELPDREPPYAYEMRRIEKSVALVDVADVLGITQDQLKELNAGVRYGVTPPEGYELRVPLGLGESLALSMSDIPEAMFTPPPETLKYRVRRGDTLGHIAQRYRTSVRKVKSMNRLRNDRIRIGQVLKVPGKRYNSTVYASSQRSIQPENATSRSQLVSVDRNASSYTIRRGDSLSKIARDFRTTVSSLRQVNGLQSDRLSIGQVVNLPGSPPDISTVTMAPNIPPQTRTTALSYTVRRGDTLSEIARRFGIGLSKLNQANPSTRARRLQIGQILTIPDARTTVSAAETHVVRRGESLWSIARLYELSLARILKLNDLRQGDIIRPGQILRIASQ